MSLTRYVKVAALFEYDYHFHYVIVTFIRCAVKRRPSGGGGCQEYSYRMVLKEYCVI